MSTIGYYSIKTYSCASFQVDEITVAGYTAVNISTLSASELSTIDELNVVYASNSNNGSEYLNNMANIQATVTSGMNLVVFVRTFRDADAFLPGTGTMPSVRSTESEIDIAASAPTIFVNGVGGVLTDTLSGGVGSDHIQGGNGSDSIYGDLGED